MITVTVMTVMTVMRPSWLALGPGCLLLLLLQAPGCLPRLVRVGAIFTEDQKVTNAMEN